MAFLSKYRWALAGLLFVLCAFVIPRLLPIATTRSDLTQNDKTQEEYDRTVFKAFAETHADAVINVGDDAFSEYVFHELQDICPFYVPNGVAYRDCLERIVDNGKVGKSETLIKSGETFCRTVSAEYTGIESNNLFLSCFAYKLK